MKTSDLCWGTNLIQVCQCCFTGEVYELLRPNDVEQHPFRHRHRLLGKRVCRHAFRTLLGIGSSRFMKLNRAAQWGLPVPNDGRFVASKFSRRAHENRQLVTEFLAEIYHTISEPLPENHGGKSEVAGQCPKQDPQADSDPKPKPRLMFRKHRGRRPRIVADAGRNKDKKNLRMLPPGTFSDYLNLLRNRYPSNRISLKLFCKALGDLSVNIFFSSEC